MARLRPGDRLHDRPAACALAVETELGAEAVEPVRASPASSGRARASGRSARRRTRARRRAASGRSRATARARGEDVLAVQVLVDEDELALRRCQLARELADLAVERPPRDLVGKRAEAGRVLPEPREQARSARRADPSAPTRRGTCPARSARAGARGARRRGAAAASRRRRPSARARPPPARPRGGGAGSSGRRACRRRAPPAHDAAPRRRDGYGSPSRSPHSSRDGCGELSDIPATLWRVLGVWRSLVARSVRVGEVPSSNLGTPIIQPEPYAPRSQARRSPSSGPSSGRRGSATMNDA